MNEKALSLHKELRGKLEVRSRVKVDSMQAMSLAYTPGVADVCRAIEDNKNLYLTTLTNGTTLP
jgi:malate dehydrogenase (oxaloacetate-decarboxylating)